MKNVGNLRFPICNSSHITSIDSLGTNTLEVDVSQPTFNVNELCETYDIVNFYSMRPGRKGNPALRDGNSSYNMILFNFSGYVSSHRRLCIYILSIS